MLHLIFFVDNVNKNWYEIVSKIVTKIMEEIGNIVIKWSGKEYTISNLQKMTTVLQLKNLIFAETGVLPERQKLLGLKCSGMWHF